MIIGILSDSHGKADRVRKAMALFARRDVQAVVHCGDVGSSECLLAIRSTGSAAYAVAGNTDRHVDRLESVARECGVSFSWEVVEVPIGEGKCLVATHGRDSDVLNELIVDGQFPYVCHGHTHRVRDECVGGVRIINPGALRNCRSPHYPTVAVLDTKTDVLEHLRVQ